MSAILLCLLLVCGGVQSATYVRYARFAVPANASLAAVRLVRLPAKANWTGTVALYLDDADVPTHDSNANNLDASQLVRPLSAHCASIRPPLSALPIRV